MPGPPQLTDGRGPGGDGVVGDAVVVSAGISQATVQRRLAVTAAGVALAYPGTGHSGSVPGAGGAAGPALPRSCADRLTGVWSLRLSGTVS